MHMGAAPNLGAVIIDQERRVYGIFLEYEFCISWTHLINIYSNHQSIFSGQDFHNFNYASEFFGCACQCILEMGVLGGCVER